MILFLALGLLIGVVAIIFALQNMQTITVTFFAWQFDGSLALILLLAVASGILMSLLFALPDVIRKSFLISKLKNTNDKLSDEVVNKKIEVEVEKSKVAANNAYLDDLEKNPRV